MKTEKGSASAKSKSESEREIASSISRVRVAIAIQRSATIASQRGTIARERASGDLGSANRDSESEREGKRDLGSAFCFAKTVCEAFGLGLRQNSKEFHIGL